jgi:hypothetical protein
MMIFGIMAKAVLTVGKVVFTARKKGNVIGVRMDILFRNPS